MRRRVFPKRRSGAQADAGSARIDEIQDVVRQASLSRQSDDAVASIDENSLYPHLQGVDAGGGEANQYAGPALVLSFVVEVFIVVFLVQFVLIKPTLGVLPKGSWMLCRPRVVLGRGGRLNVVGAPPFQGALRHHGWRAREVKLPPAKDGGDQTLVAPAEVEL